MMTVSRLQKVAQMVLRGLEWIGISVQSLVTCLWQWHRSPYGKWITGSISIATMLIFLHHHASASAKKNHSVPFLPVVVTTAHYGDMPIYLSALGTVTPAATVTVKAQVSGQLMRVLFHEGQMVKAGEVLAEIDARPYQAQFTQYQGQLARDRALLANAKLDLSRYQTLWRQNAVSKQTLDTQAALVKQIEGTVQLDEGLLQSAQVNLNYTKITAPIDGKIGVRLVDAGNIVQPSDAAGIVIINKIAPITVIFTLAEDYVPTLLTQIAASAKGLLVEAYDRGQTQLLATGKLLMVDNQIDPATGTLKLRAEFANQDGHLFPNQFVNVKLLITALHQAVLVPVAAIQHGAQDMFVYVLNADQVTIQAKPIKTQATFADEAAVTGISAGQAVVVEGTDRLTDGAKVNATFVSSPAERGLHPPSKL